LQVERSDGQWQVSIGPVVDRNADGMVEGVLGLDGIDDDVRTDREIKGLRYVSSVRSE
jgi:hypothetical protein